MLPLLNSTTIEIMCEYLESTAIYLCHTARWDTYCLDDRWHALQEATSCHHFVFDFGSDCQIRDKKEFQL